MAIVEDHQSKVDAQPRERPRARYDIADERAPARPPPELSPEVCSRVQGARARAPASSHRRTRAAVPPCEDLGNDTLRLMSARRIGLLELVAPLSKRAFIADHWEPERFYLSAPSPALIAELARVEGLADPHALLRRHDEDVRLFHPRHPIIAVPPRAAADLLPAGFNLYIRNVERSVPEAMALLMGVARDLGLPPGQVRLEAFAGSRGGISPRHYDGDANFQILLSGEKEWELESSSTIKNPLEPCVPQADPRRRWASFYEEAYAEARNLPEAFDPQRSTILNATAGTVLYLPRGVWHETRSHDDTWGLNLVIRGSTWAKSVTDALLDALSVHPVAREFSAGLSLGQDEGAEDVRRAEHKLAAVRALAGAALESLALDDVLLSSTSRVRYRWADGADARTVELVGGVPHLRVPGVCEPIALDPDVAATMAELCTFRYVFNRGQLRHALRDTDTSTLVHVIALLVRRGLVIEVHPR